MSIFEVTELRDSTIWKLFRMRERIQVDPVYQRLGEIWTQDKRQLLIDSVLNGFDVPKIYLHKFSSPKKIGNRTLDYAVIDGRQRLETIWSFIQGELNISSDFEYFKDESIDGKDMTYSELGQSFPDLKADFDGFPLNVVCIETADMELIEEMFSRLNEAVPLSAPEKRNALGGPVPVAVRALAQSIFFTKKIPFSNKRYRHYDIAVKFLLFAKEKKITDTKKVYLDKFVEHYSDLAKTKKLDFSSDAAKTLESMSLVFVNADSLLKSIGMVVLYFHLFRVAVEGNWIKKVTRSKLVAFENLRAKNRVIAEKDLTKADYELIEFDRYSQSPNDSYAVKLRLSIILKIGFGIKRNIESL